ncbi:MAG: hypothetical protein ACLRXY_02255, partial [Acutalibacteraceae bacterium]
GNLYDTDRFIDIKISCREQMLQKLMDYDPAKGAEYATYIYPFIWDSMLRFRMGEEKWSVSSLTNYKMVRSMAWLYHNTKDAVNQFSKKYNCDLALAEEYLKVVRGIRNQQPFYITDEDGEETGEDIALDDSWNYTDILWNGIQAEKVQRAFEKLNYREQTLLEKRLAICMTCGRVGSWKNRPTFEELAIMFEGSTASGAERAYRKAVDKLTELLVAEGALHAVRLKQKTKTKRKRKSPPQSTNIKQTATANGAKFQLILRTAQQRLSDLLIGIQLKRTGLPRRRSGIFYHCRLMLLQNICSSPLSRHLYLESLQPL